MELFSLQGKTVLIVGATSEIGGAAAKACVEAGANLVLTGRNADALTALQEELTVLATAASQSVTSVICDLTDAAGIAASIAAFPSFDGVVFSTGVL